MDKGGIAWRGWFPVAGELTSRIPDLDLQAEIGTYGDYLLGKVNKVFPVLASSKLGSPG